MSALASKLEAVVVKLVLVVQQLTNCDFVPRSSTRLARAILSGLS